MEALYLLLFAAMVLIPFAGFLVGLKTWTLRRAHKRTTDLQEVAGKLGLQFYPQGDSAFISALAPFHLLSHGHAKRVSNMLHGRTDDVELGIFDYQYTIGGGRSSSTYRQTVVCFQSPLLQMPAFLVRPENLLDRVGRVFGYRDINFESHPTFSQAFVLRGSDEPLIREVFDAKVLQLFEGMPGICLEGSGDRLIFYRSHVRVEPANVRSFMDEGFNAFLLFRNRSQQLGLTGGSPFGPSR